MSSTTTEGNVLEQPSPLPDTGKSPSTPKAPSSQRQLLVSPVAAVSPVDLDTVFLSKTIFRLDELLDGGKKQTQGVEGRETASSPSTPSRFGVRVTNTQGNSQDNHHFTGESCEEHHPQRPVSGAANAADLNDMYASAPVVSMKHKVRRWRPPRSSSNSPIGAASTDNTTARNAQRKAEQVASARIKRDAMKRHLRSAGGSKAGNGWESFQTPPSLPRMVVVPVDEAHVLVSYSGASATLPSTTASTIADKARQSLQVKDSGGDHGAGEGVFLVSPALDRVGEKVGISRGHVQRGLPFPYISGYVRDYTHFNTHHNARVIRRLWLEKKSRYQVAMPSHQGRGGEDADGRRSEPGNETVLIDVTDSGGGEDSRTERQPSPTVVRPLFNEEDDSNAAAAGAEDREENPAKPSLITVSASTASRPASSTTPAAHAAEAERREQRTKAQQKLLWEEEMAIERAYASKWSHRFLVSDEVHNAIWALQVSLDRAGSSGSGAENAVRVVPPSEFFDLVTEDSVLSRRPSPSPKATGEGSVLAFTEEDSPMGKASPRSGQTPLSGGGGGGDDNSSRQRSRSRSAASPSAQVAERMAVPLLGGGSSGFVDGHFSIARFCRPTALCWRLEDGGDEGGSNETDHTTASPPMGHGAAPRAASASAVVVGGGNSSSSSAVYPFSHPTCSVLFISDSGNHAIRYANFGNRIVRTIAGLDGVPGYRDGGCVSSLLREATAMAWCSSGLVFADGPNAVLRLITGIGKQQRDSKKSNVSAIRSGSGGALAPSTPLTSGTVEQAANQAPAEAKTAEPSTAAGDALLDELLDGGAKPANNGHAQDGTAQREPSLLAVADGAGERLPAASPADAGVRHAPLLPETANQTPTRTPAAAAGDGESDASPVREAAPSATVGQPRVWTIAGAQNARRHTFTQPTPTSDEAQPSEQTYVDSAAANRAFIGFPADVAIVSDGTVGSAKVLFLDRDSHAVRVLDENGVSTLVGPLDYESLSYAEDDMTEEKRPGSASGGGGGKTQLPAGLTMPTQLLACSLVKERAPLLFHSNNDNSSSSSDGIAAAAEQIATPDAYLHSSHLLLFIASAVTGAVSMLLPVPEAAMQRIAEEHEETRKANSGPHRLSWEKDLLAQLELGLATEGRRTIGEAGLPSLRRLVLPFPERANNNDDDDDDDDGAQQQSKEEEEERRQLEARAAATIAEQYVRLHFPGILPPPVARTERCLANLYAYISGRQDGVTERQRRHGCPSSPFSDFTSPLFRTPPKRVTPTELQRQPQQQQKQQQRPSPPPLASTAVRTVNTHSAEREDTADTDRRGSTEDYLLVDVSPQSTVRRDGTSPHSAADCGNSNHSDDGADGEGYNSGCAGESAVDPLFTSGEGAVRSHAHVQNPPAAGPLLYPPERTILQELSPGHPDHDPRGTAPASSLSGEKEPIPRRRQQQLFQGPQEAMQAKGSGNAHGLSRGQVSSYRQQFGDLDEGARKERVRAVVEEAAEFVQVGDDDDTERGEGEGGPWQHHHHRGGGDGAHRKLQHDSQSPVSGHRPSRSRSATQPLTPRALSAHRLMQPRGGGSAAPKTAGKRRAFSVPPALPAATGADPTTRTATTTTKEGLTDEKKKVMEEEGQGTALTRIYHLTASAYDDAVARLFTVYEYFADKKVEHKAVAGPAPVTERRQPVSRRGRGPSSSSASMPSRALGAALPPAVVAVEKVATYSMTYLSLVRFLYHTGYLDLPVRLAAASAEESGMPVLTVSAEDGLCLPLSPTDWRGVAFLLHACGVRVQGYHVLSNMNFALFRRLVLLLSLWESQVHLFVDRSSPRQEEAQSETAGGTATNSSPQRDSDDDALRYGLLDALPSLDSLREEEVIAAYKCAHARALERVPGFRAKQHWLRRQQQQRQQRQFPLPAAVAAAASRPQHEGDSPPSSLDLSPIQGVSPRSPLKPTSDPSPLVQHTGTSPTSPPTPPSPAPVARSFLTPASLAVDEVLQLLAKNEPTLRQLFDAYSRPVRVRRSTGYRAPTAAAAAEAAVSNASSLLLLREDATAGAGSGKHRRSLNAVPSTDLQYFSGAPAKGRAPVKPSSAATGPASPVAAAAALHFLSPRQCVEATAAAIAPQDLAWKVKQLFTSSAQENTTTRQTVSEHVPVLTYTQFQSLFRAVDVFPTLVSQNLLQLAFIDALRAPLFPLPTSVTRQATSPATAAAMPASPGDDERASALAALQGICDARKRRRAHAAAPFGHDHTLPNEGTGEEHGTAEDRPAAGRKRARQGKGPSSRCQQDAAQAAAVSAFLRDNAALTFPVFVDAFVRVALTAFSLAGTSDAEAYPTTTAKVAALCLWINKQVLLGLVAEREATAQRVGIGSRGDVKGGGGGRGSATRAGVPSRSSFPAKFMLFKLPSPSAERPEAREGHRAHIEKSKLCR